MRVRCLRGVPVILTGLALSHGAAAAPTGNDVFGALGASGKQGLGQPLQIVLLLGALSLLPAVIASVTPFLRITLVLHFLRQALGLQTTPSNQVLIGLALFLSILIMQPVIGQVWSQAWEPMEKGEIGMSEAADRATPLLRGWLSKYAREKDVALMLKLANSPAPRTPADLELKVLIPAYVLSELKTGFQIGAVLFLPFLIIDIVVASVTLSVGMVQLPPVMISAPFKILLFVLVDGWTLVVGSLVRSF